jgi:hypothetical protein
MVVAGGKCRGISLLVDTFPARLGFLVWTVFPKTSDLSFERELDAS